MSSITFFHYFAVACFLFVTGLFCILSKRNVIAVLLGVELVLNATNLNLVALGRFPGWQPQLAHEGQVLALFVIVLAATEAALALGIALCFYSLHRAPDLDEAQDLKG